MKKYFILCSVMALFLLKPDLIHAGQKPLYNVQSGDTLWKIAHKHGTTIEDLRVTNGLQSNLLLVGQKLKVPSKYTVKPGDTLWKIAVAHNTSLKRLKEINGITSYWIYPGQKLSIPRNKLNMQGQHVLMSREEFKEWLMNKKIIRNVVRLQQHHTWTPSYDDFNGSNHFTLLKGMQQYHTEEMGWNNIAQNLTTFPDGKVAVSRPLNTTPQGTSGAKANTGGILIENVGNFDKGNDQMTPEQKETIIYINALLSIKLGLTPSIDSLTYHHWWDLKTGERVLDQPGHTVKTCPGTGFFGGNSTNSAKSNFYPLVREKIREIQSSLE